MRKQDIVVIIASLGAALILLAVSWGLKPLTVSEGWAVLRLDREVSDRLIQERLREAGIGTAISESTQTVYYDDFGVLRAVPLDRWDGIIEDYDPRHDGYAEKLRAVFVDDAERRIFVPLEASAFGTSPVIVRKRFQAALGDIPFSLEVSASRSFTLVSLLFFAGAAVLMVIFSKNRKLWAFCLPPMAFFPAFGPAAALIPGVLCLFFQCLFAPLREVFLSGAKRGALKMYKKSFMAAAVPAVCCIVLAVLAAIPPWVAVPGFVLSGAVFVLALRNETLGRRSLGHVLFIPMPILPAPSEIRRIHWFLGPFLASSMALVLLPSARDFHSEQELLNSVTVEDFEAHIAFQREFSYRPLGREKTAEYGAYTLGEDGLIAGFSPEEPPEGEFTAPNFKKIVREEEVPLFNLKNIVSLLIGFSGIMISWFGKKPVKHKGALPAIYHDKQVAA
jgi:hypothetical protein